MPLAVCRDSISLNSLTPHFKALSFCRGQAPFSPMASSLASSLDTLAGCLSNHKQVTTGCFFFSPPPKCTVMSHYAHPPVSMTTGTERGIILRNQRGQIRSDQRNQRVQIRSDQITKHSQPSWCTRHSPVPFVFLLIIEADIKSDCK